MDAALARRLLATQASGTADTALTLARGAAALIFVVFGIGKFSAHASEVESFDKYGLPEPDALVYAIGILEIGGGILLGLGILTRLVALVMAGNMVAAIALSGIGEGEVVPSLTLAPALLVIMVFLVVLGPGRPSLDERLLRRVAPP
ncbi:MAG TPA: DoxX family protein [Gemmatimonadales bacterium]|nr:DoxX family protein [Gemmatimonadales bacterium]